MSEPFSESPPLSDLDQALLREYRLTNRSLDALPYSPDFETLYANVASDSDLTRREVLHRLYTLRKAGRLPRTGHRQEPLSALSETDAAILEDLVVEAVGSLGRRDQLPYTPAFDDLLVAFNGLTKRNLMPFDLWQAILRLAK